MKLNTSIRKTPKGVTLIELSVVIAVILVLISVLFIGAGYYRDSSNNAACQINQSSIRKAADSYLNISTNVDTLAAVADIEGANLPFAANSAPSCPSNNTYTLTAANGQVTVMTCNDENKTHDDQL